VINDPAIADTAARRRVFLDRPATSRKTSGTGPDNAAPTRVSVLRSGSDSPSCPNSIRTPIAVSIIAAVNPIAFSAVDLWPRNSRIDAADAVADAPK